MRSLLFLSLLLLAAAESHAQSTETDLKARLLHKPLYLRGFWHDDKLNFDPTGHLIGTSTPTSFTVSGIDIHSVQLTPNHLILEGDRVGLLFNEKPPTRIPLALGSYDHPTTEPIHLEIATPSTGDFSPALDAIFLDKLRDLVPLVPFFWKPYAQNKFRNPPQITRSPVSGAAPGEAPPTPYPLTPPGFDSVVDLQWSDYARTLRKTGIVQLKIELGADARPKNVQVVSALGLGLDEQAILASVKSTYKAARQNGQPIPIVIDVQYAFKGDEEIHPQGKSPVNPKIP